MSQRVRAWSRAACSAGSVVAFGVATLAASEAGAEVPVQRTFFRLASSNGHGAVMVDLSQRRLTHFREHLFASEEPRVDAGGNELWEGNQPQVVKTRDLLYDAYFGLRMGGSQQWLTGVPVDLDQSGYAGWQDGAVGGTGVATMVQKVGDLEATQFFFAPRGLEHAAMVMAMRLRNTGATAQSGVSIFSLHNFHLGFGRPGPLAEIGENGETIENAGGPGVDLAERAFAGVVVARALAPVAHAGASNAATAAAQNVFAIVDGGGTSDLPDLVGAAPTADGSVSAYQFDVGTLGAGDERWVGVVFAHHGDPFATETVRGWLDAWAAGRSAEDVVSDEIAEWTAFQGTISVPPSATADEVQLLRHSAAVLRMAQVRSKESYLREVLSADGEPRYTRFGTTLDGPPATLPATVAHRGAGALLASLPPGEWTYAWIRDGAYGTAAMAALGMKDEARASLSFYLGAEAGLFQDYNELSSYGMPPYQISLTRYHGFGVEETDFNDFGPNLEFDGLGLFLWSLRAYETLTGDETLASEQWPLISGEIADVLLALIDPETGLIKKDSSIWETHWNGRERHWAYTSITAARGLCDAATIAERLGDAAKATAYREAGVALRAAIAGKLTDANGALASNVEELASGAGHFDAAVLDGIAMGLFDPEGRIAKATLAALDANLLAPAGAGWSRNDDRFDHGGAEDLSPWGSEYDSAEWVVTDLRGAVAARRAGDTARSERLLKWVREQSAMNYLAVAETYDEGNGTYKFNAPMAGFGAGAWALALFDRDGLLGDAACGAYFDEGAASGAGGAGGANASSGVGVGAGNGNGSDPGAEDGCGCRVGEGTRGLPIAPAALGVLALAALMRRRRATHLTR